MSFAIGDQELSNFRAKYAGVHPLVFQRSIEKAVSALDLFEILETIPSGPPFSWDEETRSWVSDEDIMVTERLKSMLKRRK
jgi:hypothetical protein